MVGSVAPFVSQMKTVAGAHFASAQARGWLQKPTAAWADLA